MPPKKPATKDIDIPDGYSMQPHGLGLLRVNNDVSALADNAAGDGSGQGRYSLRRPRTPRVATQSLMLLRTTKPVATNKHSSLDNEPSADISSSIITRDTSVVMSLEISTFSNSTTSTDTNTISTATAELQEPSQKPRRTTGEGTTVEILEVKQDQPQAGEKKKILKKNLPLYQQYTSVPWGSTPFPDHLQPSEASCEKVFEILRKQHANSRLNFIRPGKIQAPSLEVAGCGETQLLLDGLARTCLSGATTMKNADNTIKRIVEYYGTITKSAMVGGKEVTPVANCIDWDKVRQEGIVRLEEIIRCGGLQRIGSKAVLGILNATHLENTERVTAFKDEKATGVPARVSGADSMKQEQKDLEIWMFENGVISLEHLRSLPAETAMKKLVQFHGVGVKTAACVLLFCLQEDCFAVDTHCFRLASWLGWIPAHLKGDSGRDKAFAHLDLRIPDHLKYGLHQLFIEHGQTCYRCKANSVESGKQWEECVCSLEALLKRTRNTSSKGPASRKRKLVAMGDAEDAGEVSDPDNLELGGSDAAEEELNPELYGDGGVGDNLAPDSMKTIALRSRDKKKLKVDEEFKPVAQRRTRKPENHDDDEDFVPGSSKRIARKPRKAATK